MSSADQMPQGPPNVAAYESHLQSAVFCEMERFSADFNERNRPALINYSKKWVIDPLHQWSRVWEYPFVESQIATYAQGSDDFPLRILDAGSGVTFFPFLLASHLDGVSITCCDRDPLLTDVFPNLHHPAADAVRFVCRDIGQTFLDEASFDAIYCVSVLEHTDNPFAVLQEFIRLLRPGGLFVLTFDISLDGCSEISIDGAFHLLQELRTRLTPTDCEQLEALLTGNALSDPELVDTLYFKRHDPGRLPWKYPLLSASIAALRRGRLPRHAVKHLTFACFSFLKP